MRTQIEAARGGTAVFANGSLGGMVTADVDEGASVSERSTFVDEMGRRLAEVALSALEHAEPADVRQVGFRSAPVELVTDNELFQLMERIGLIEPHPRGTKGGFITEVARIDLGPAKWALVPGEPTPMVGQRIKQGLAEAGARHPLVIGLGNDELGYILDPAQYDDPEFAYEVSVSVGRETAPALEAALAAL